MKAQRNIVGYIFVAPALLFFVIFVLIPLVLSLVLSFFQTDMFFMDMEFIRLDNFKRVFQDSLFWRSIVNILLYTLMAVPLNVICSLVLASLVNTRLSGAKVFLRPVLSAQHNELGRRQHGLAVADESLLRTSEQHSSTR